MPQARPKIGTLHPHLGDGRVSVVELSADEIADLAAGLGLLHCGMCQGTGGDPRETALPAAYAPSCSVCLGTGYEPITCDHEACTDPLRPGEPLAVVAGRTLHPVCAVEHFYQGIVDLRDMLAERGDGARARAADLAVKLSEIRRNVGGAESADKRYLDRERHGAYSVAVAVDGVVTLLGRLLGEG